MTNSELGSHGYGKKHFDFFRQLILDEAGITLKDSKMEMVFNRTKRLLKEHRFEHFDQLCDFLKNRAEGADEDISWFINAMTTNLTSFFREKHHFETLADRVIPEFVKAGGKDFKVWCSAASTGQEPYTISMTVQEALQKHAGINFSLLATDIDSNVLQTGKNGIYDLDAIKGLNPEHLSRWFYKGKGEQEGLVKARPELQAPISFELFNLLHTPNFNKKFDVIFCRNVLIYFDTETRNQIIERFSKVLKPNGYLFLGHSEVVRGYEEIYQFIGNTTYLRLP